MTIQLSCPTNATHTTFEVTGLAYESWEVDAEAEFIKKLDFIGADPCDPEDVFTCRTCGARAEVTEKNTPHDP